jgi:hypothetical protein
VGRLKNDRKTTFTLKYKNKAVGQKELFKTAFHLTAFLSFLLAANRL